MRADHPQVQNPALEGRGNLKATCQAVRTIAQEPNWNTVSRAQSTPRGYFVVVNVFGFLFLLHRFLLLSHPLAKSLDYIPDIVRETHPNISRANVREVGVSNRILRHTVY